MNELIKIQLPDVSQEITLENEWFQKRDVMLAEAQGYTVATANNADIIGEVVSKLGKMASKIEGERKKLTAPFLTAQKTIKAVVDKATEPINAETTRLKILLGEFANAERKRLDEEARKAEMERLEREAAAAERQKKEEELFGSSVAVSIIEPEPAQQTSPKVDGVRLSESISFKIVDENQIPVQFMTFDAAKLRAWISDHKAELLEQLKCEDFRQPIAGIVLKIDSKVAIK